MYEIKDQNCNIIKTTNHSNEAYGWYEWTKKEYGYAEAWHKGKLIFKTK